MELSDEALESLSLEDLQRIRNKRWAHGLKELQARADAELARRDPRTDWKCLRCGREHFHEREIRVSGGFLESFWGWERNQYHVLVCNYCGKSEFYKTLMSGAQESIGFLGN
ncbi:MAG: zinc ribbon domain-containing protein [Pseudomonadota bacterium]